MLGVNDFHTVPIEESLVSHRNRGIKNNRHFIINEIDYVNIYSLFKFKYGYPNGLLTKLRKKNDSDNLFHWDYVISNDEIQLHFIYSNNYLEVMSVGLKVKLPKDIKEQILQMLNSSIKQYSNEIARIKNELESWDIFQNTYLRLKRTISYLFDYYINNYDVKELEMPNIFEEKSVELYQSVFTHNVENINLIKSYGLSLKMLLPVLGESFVNLIIFVLGKEEITRNTRIFESITRQNIDVRVACLHLYINGLDSPLDCSNENIKSYFKIMNQRNNFLHGNVVPKVNSFDSVYFDGNIPIFKTPRDMNVNFQKQALFQISKEEIQNDYDDINNFINYILECLPQENKKLMEKLMEFSELGFNKKTKRVGILFPEVISAAFPIFK